MGDNIKEKNIISFSGGKDSTAMLLMMLENNIHIDDIIFCDTGKEFPQIYIHIEQVEKYINRKIIRLRAEHSFEYMMGKYTRKRRDGKGINIGYGWPDFRMRWCTGYFKTNITKKYLKGVKYILYVGIAADETQRLKHNKNGINYSYPLVDWNITEKQALQYCYDKGFDWQGLYQKFKRVSCYCCPLKSLSEFKILYEDFPVLWKDIKKMDKLSHAKKFRKDYSVYELEQKFEKIKKQDEEQYKIF